MRRAFLNLAAALKPPSLQCVLFLQSSTTLVPIP
jgi:hypothetical protein